MTKSKPNKRLMAAIVDHQKSGRDIDVAKQRVDNFTAHLFTALKDQEKALAQYTKTSHRLVKIRGYG